MSGKRVERRLRGLAMAVPADAARPRGRHPRVRRLALAASAAALACLIVFMATGLVANPWYRLVSVEGGSMWPSISHGDVIVVGPAPAKIQPGMILVLTVDDQVVTHRVIVVNADGTFVTRGDANSVNDDWDSGQVRVKGRYLATIPLVGRIVTVRNTSGAWFADALTGEMNITVGPWATDTPSPSESPTASPTSAATASATPTQEATASPTAAATASATPTQEATASPTSAATASATPTLPDTGGTPTPTPTLPDTSGPLGRGLLPADPSGSLFLLILIGSVAGLAFMLLPRRRNSRPVAAGTDELPAQALERQPLEEGEEGTRRGDG